MITEQRVKEIVRSAVNDVKISEPQYEGVDVTDEMVILGNDGLFDSIAFSAFAVAIEERLENETGQEFVTNVEQIFRLNPGRSSISVDQLSSSIHQILNQAR